MAATGEHTVSSPESAGTSIKSSTHLTRLKLHVILAEVDIVHGLVDPLQRRPGYDEIATLAGRRRVVVSLQPLASDPGQRGRVRARRVVTVIIADGGFAEAQT